MFYIRLISASVCYLIALYSLYLVFTGPTLGDKAIMAFLGIVMLAVGAGIHQPHLLEKFEDIGS